MGHLHRAYESQLRVRSLADTGPYRSLLGRRTVTPMWVLLVPIDGTFDFGCCPCRLIPPSTNSDAYSSMSPQAQLGQVMCCPR